MSSIVATQSNGALHQLIAQGLVPPPAPLVSQGTFKRFLDQVEELRPDMRSTVAAARGELARGELTKLRKGWERQNTYIPSFTKGSRTDAEYVTGYNMFDTNGWRAFYDGARGGIVGTAVYLPGKWFRGVWPGLSVASDALQIWSAHRVDRALGDAKSSNTKRAAAGSVGSYAGAAAAVFATHGIIRALGASAAFAGLSGLAASIVGGILGGMAARTLVNRHLQSSASPVRTPA